MVHGESFVDPDGSPWFRFSFAVDGRLAPPWEIPRSHRARFGSEEDFDSYLARSAVRMMAEGGR